jgi:hypothetical protein
MVEFMNVFLMSNQESFPVLSQLVATGVVLPVTSVSCERGVSAFNAIKTDSRNKLSASHISIMMVLYLESPSIEDFNYDRAFEIWLEMKSRKQFLSMIKCNKKM